MTPILDLIWSDFLESGGLAIFLLPLSVVPEVATQNLPPGIPLVLGTLVCVLLQFTEFLYNIRLAHTAKFLDELLCKISPSDLLSSSPESLVPIIGSTFQEHLHQFHFRGVSHIDKLEILLTLSKSTSWDFLP